MWEKSGIGFRLKCMIGVLLVVSSLAIISINAVLSRKALEDEIRNKTMPALVGEIEANVALWLALPADTLKALARHPMLLEWIQEGENPAKRPLITQMSRDFMQTYHSDSVNVILQNSTNFYETTPSGEQVKKIDPAVDAWFFAFEKSGLPAAMNIHVSNDPTYADTAFINTRIEDRRGHFLGVLSTSFTVESIAKRIATMKIGEKGVSFVARKNGDILLHPDSGRLKTRLADLPGFADITEELLRHPDKIYSTFNEAGERILVTGREVPVLDAVAFTVANTSELFADVSLAWRYSALAGLAVLGFGFLLSSHLVASITRSLRRVSRFAENVASGKAIEPFADDSFREMTDLGQALNDMNHKLRQSSVSLEALHGVLNGMDALLYVTDPETDEILFMNTRMQEHFGLSGDLTGKICWQVLQDGFSGRCPFCPMHTLDNDPDARIKWEEHNTVTGRYYSNTDCLIDWADHRKVHLQHSVDVTDRKIAEEDLKRQLQQQELMATLSQSFISSAGMPILISNALRITGEFTGVSRTFLSRYHEEKDHFVLEYEWLNEEQSATDAQSAGMPASAEVMIHKAFIRGKDLYVAVADIREHPEHADFAEIGIKAFMGVPIMAGGRFWGILGLDESRDVRPWSDSDTHLIRLIGSVISGAVSRSMTEDTLTRMSAIVESSPQYITYVNKKGEFQYFSPGALANTGYSQEEFTGGNISMIFDKDTHAHVINDILPRVIAEGKHSFELPLIRKNGEERIFSFSCFATRLDDIGIGTIALDVTEKHRLANDLVTAKEQAEQSSRAKGDFLSRMSHEMRTPLNAIIGMTGIARASTDPEKKEYCLEKVESASTHLLGVINDILDMSKIEADKFELSRTEFVFERMLMRMLNVVQFRIDEKAQELTVAVDENVPFSVISDEQRLGQVIANLLSNAVKFTPEKGAISLRVRNLGEDENSVLLEVAVSDTGIGISKESQARLFTSFEQADGGIARKFGGTGLGLAISRRIVELMGGAIRVESEPGQGSSFIFTVRAERGSVVRRQMLSRDVNWKNVRILAVDDAPEVREYFLHLSKSVSIACDVAEDGHAAFALLEEKGGEHYAVIFADWKMPGMDGIELTRKIKEKYGDRVVVIMISSSEWAEIQEEALAAGVDKFLAKPLFSSQIMDCIAQCLGHGPSAREESDARNVQKDVFRGRRILLAEDILINREIVLSLLEETGIAIDCAEDGGQAFEMFRADPLRYDLIFMDIHMPEVDGYEATRRIRALGLPTASSVPIVAMTANVFREDVEKCLAAGMNDHIGKPIEIEAIIEKLRRYLPRPA